GLTGENITGNVCGLEGGGISLDQQARFVREVPRRSSGGDSDFDIEKLDRKRPSRFCRGIGLGRHWLQRTRLVVSAQEERTGDVQGGRSNVQSVRVRRNSLAASVRI
ncbi:hypothetical protein T310_10300, partial [Rasamsonia emersonii CBS 393.64]